MCTLRVLQRVERDLAGSPFPELALQVSELILRVQGVEIEMPATEEVTEICEEFREEPPPLTAREQIEQDVVGGKNLLIELVKRTAHDWVLYRGSRKMVDRRLAEDAYIWLFLEDEDHYHWQIRQGDGKDLTSFLSICDVLDLDPARIRARIRTLTTQQVKATGRTPGHTRNEVYDAHVSVHAAIPAEDVEEVPMGSFF